MKEKEVSKIVEFLGTNYVFTHYFGSEVLRIQEYVGTTLLGKPKWKTIYFGHIDPLEQAVRFFKTPYEKIPQALRT